MEFVGWSVMIMGGAGVRAVNLSAGDSLWLLMSVERHRILGDGMKGGEVEGGAGFAESGFKLGWWLVRATERTWAFVARADENVWQGGGEALAGTGMEDCGNMSWFWAAD